MMTDLLYHYTNTAGLVGILESSVLWATNIEYMNDESELRYAQAVVISVVADAIPKLPESPITETLKEFEKIGDAFLDAQVFACCFCANGDLLSMWRAYGTGGGYALGFDKESLDAIPLTYGRQQQETEIADLINALMATWLGRKWPEEDPPQDEAVRAELMELMKKFLVDVYRKMVRYKDQAFSEEKEFRILSFEQKYPQGLDRIWYRLAQSNLVPYVLVPEGKPKDAKLPLKEVRYGPSMHPALTEKALRLVLDKNGYADVEIKRSKVPLRVNAPSSAKV